MVYAVRVVEKAEVYYNRDMPSADRNAKKSVSSLCPIQIPLTSCD